MINLTRITGIMPMSEWVPARMPLLPGKGVLASGDTFDRI